MIDTEALLAEIMAVAKLAKQTPGALTARLIGNGHLPMRLLRGSGIWPETESKLKRALEAERKRLSQPAQ